MALEVIKTCKSHLHDKVTSPEWRTIFPPIENKLCWAVITKIKLQMNWQNVEKRDCSISVNIHAKEKIKKESANIIRQERLAN